MNSTHASLQTFFSKNKLCGLITVPLGIALLGLSSCGEDREAIFHANPEKHVDSAEKEIAAEIAMLSKGKNPRDIEASAAYDEAVGALTKRGSTIETRMIDTLRTNPDWSIRMGSIDVLQSIGTKVCVEHLIAALLDEESLVAFKANATLEELTKHTEIPAVGKPTEANGLPAVPLRDKHDLALDAEQRTWAIWHHQYGKQLHDSWKAWWELNKTATRIE